MWMVVDMCARSIVLGLILVGIITLPIWMERLLIPALRGIGAL